MSKKSVMTEKEVLGLIMQTIQGDLTNENLLKTQNGRAYSFLEYILKNVSVDNID